MQNKLTSRVANSGIVEYAVKEKLYHEYSLEEADLTPTDDGGFKFMFDDETGGDIDISFIRENGNIGICIRGSHAWK